MLGQGHEAPLPLNFNELAEPQQRQILEGLGINTCRDACNAGPGNCALMCTIMSRWRMWGSLPGIRGCQYDAALATEVLSSTPGDTTRLWRLCHGPELVQ